MDIVKELIFYGYTSQEANHIFDKYSNENKLDDLIKLIEKNKDFFKKINIRQSYN